MLLLAKLAAILIIVWFYLTAKKQGEPPVKWAIIGLVGYWISWWLANKVFLVTLSGILPKHGGIVFLITQLPAICGVIVAFFVRLKLIKDSEKNNTSTD